MIDHGALSVLGNDDFLLGLLRAGEGKNAGAGLVAYLVDSTAASASRSSMPAPQRPSRTCAVKFSLDDVVPAYG